MSNIIYGFLVGALVTSFLLDRACESRIGESCFIGIPPNSEEE